MRFLGFACVAVVSVFLIGGSLFSPPCQPPKPNGESQQEAADVKEGCPSLTRISFERVASYVHDNREDINAVSTLVIAVFTVILGVFTVQLAGSTRIAADAAELSARAAVAVESPIVAAVDIGIKRRSSWSGMDWTALPPDLCELLVKIDNFGRTPAILRRHCLDWRIAESLPSTPEYLDITEYGIGSVIKAQDGIGISKQAEFTEEQILDVSADRKLLWIYGFIEFRDFTGNTHTTGFCACWARISDRRRQFIESGPESYRYQK